MAVIPFGFHITNSGALVAGLNPTWLELYKLSDGSAVANPNAVAPITALGGGLYKIAYDPESANGELYGIVDAGNTITSASERYIPICLAADSSRATRLDANVSSRAQPGSAMSLVADAITNATLANSAVVELVGAIPAPPTAEQVAQAVIAQSIFKETTGLTGNNLVTRDFTYNARDAVESFRLRLYETPEDATADDGVTGLIASYLVTNTLDDQDRITKATTVKE